MTDLSAENTCSVSLKSAVRFGMDRRQAMQGDMPPERWTKAQADLIVKVAGGDETLPQVFWRTLDKGRTGHFLDVVTTLAARGLFTIEGGDVRITNLAMQACDEIIAVERRSPTPTEGAEA